MPVKYGEGELGRDRAKDALASVAEIVLLWAGRRTKGCVGANPILISRSCRLSNRSIHASRGACPLAMLAGHLLRIGHQHNICVALVIL